MAKTDDPAPPAGAADRPSRREAEAAVRVLIRWAGDDPDRPGLAQTPRRVADAFGELFSGYGADVRASPAQSYVEAAGYDDIVLLRDIAFHSYCEHHMVPFIGRAHIGYLPGGVVLGLSRIARVVEVFARRLQTQEAMTVQIHDALAGLLNPRGLAVLIEAEHLCMSMLGLNKPGAAFVTTRFSGAFQDDPDERARFFALARGGSQDRP